MTLQPPENPVLMAVIGAPHGVAGEVRVKSHTEDPLALGDYGLLSDAKGRRFEIQTIRPAKSVMIVRFSGIGDRASAEAIRGTQLFVERAALPEDLAPDEYYIADLVGMDVRDAVGNKFGKILAVHDFGGGSILELSLPGMSSQMIPFTRVAVPAVDGAMRIVTIDPDAAGLEAARRKTSSAKSGHSGEPV